jgi:tRNA (mo5U34)-methyltransferase
MESDKNDRQPDLPRAEKQLTHTEWLKTQIEKEAYWFHRIELAPDLVTPGWSDPKKDKLPYFGLPDDMSGMRVLDIGCAEGFFSFEAERRGAREVIAIDSFPDSVRRFNVCRNALDSKAIAYLTSVYDLSARSFGTFDLVMFFGVLYHLRHPLLALETIYGICAGTLLLQTANFEDAALGNIAAAQFHPFGIESGPLERRSLDPTVFWIPNTACVKDMLRHVGFNDIEEVSRVPGLVVRAQFPKPFIGVPPDQMKAPWS